MSKSEHERYQMVSMLLEEEQYNAVREKANKLGLSVDRYITRAIDLALAVDADSDEERLQAIIDVVGAEMVIPEDDEEEIIQTMKRNPSSR